MRRPWRVVFVAGFFFAGCASTCDSLGTGTSCERLGGFCLPRGDGAPVTCGAGATPDPFIQCYYPDEICCDYVGSFNYYDDSGVAPEGYDGSTCNNLICKPGCTCHPTDDPLLGCIGQCVCDDAGPVTEETTACGPIQCASSCICSSPARGKCACPSDTCEAVDAGSLIEAGSPDGEAPEAGDDASDQ